MKNGKSPCLYMDTSKTLRAVTVSCKLTAEFTELPD
jgi:hypothetical protein